VDGTPEAAFKWITRPCIEIESRLRCASAPGQLGVRSFTSRSFKRWDTPPSTNSINTPFVAKENLSSEYGGTNTFAGNMVATKTVSGCPSCATDGLLTKSYFYMSLPNSTLDQNQVASLVVEDAQDSAGRSFIGTFPLRELRSDVAQGFYVLGDEREVRVKCHPTTTRSSPPI
jgi:hypothetical protein